MQAHYLREALVASQSQDRCDRVVPLETAACQAHIAQAVLSQQLALLTQHLPYTEDTAADISHMP